MPWQESKLKGFQTQNSHYRSGAADSTNNRYGLTELNRQPQGEKEQKLPALSQQTNSSHQGLRKDSKGGADQVALGWTFFIGSYGQDFLSNFIGPT